MSSSSSSSSSSSEDEEVEMKENMSLVVRCQSPKKRKGKTLRGRRKKKVPVPPKDAEEEVVAPLPAILAAPGPEGPQLFGGKQIPIAGGASTGNRHSVAMKLRLAQIEKDSARLLAERKKLLEARDTLVETRTKLRREGEQLDRMMRHVNTTAASNMKGEEWEAFFDKYFKLPYGFRPDSIYYDSSDEKESDEEEQPVELDLD